MLSKLLAPIFALSLVDPAGAAPAATHTFEADGPVRGIAASFNVTDGIAGKLDYDLPDVGAVSIALRLDASGSGAGALTIDSAPVVALQFVEWELTGALAHDTNKALSQEQLARLAASIVEIWFEEGLDLGDMNGDEERWKCWAAGALTAASVAVLTVFSCGGCGVTTAVGAGAYVKKKCDKAQNNK